MATNPAKTSKPKSGRRRYRQNAEKARDEVKMTRWYLQGISQDEIAARLGISQTTVSNSLAKYHKRWLKRAEMNFDQWKAEQLAKIDMLELEALLAWEQSKRVIHSASGGVWDLSEGEETKDMTVPGDVKYWQAAMKCVEMRCRILGIASPDTEEKKLVFKVKIGANEP